MKKYLAEKVGLALKLLSYDSMAKLSFEKPKDETHGDITTNIALVLAKLVKKNPRAVAQEIVGKLHIEPQYVSHVEIAGPGFINFRFTSAFFTAQIPNILKHPDTFGKTNLGGGKKTQVEYVSANPTGPLSVGHGRQAAIGDTIANLLVWAGYDVTREYYYNNAGRQMRMLAESTYARYRQLFDPAFVFPEEGYQGDYIREIADALKKERGDSIVSLPQEEALSICKEFAEQKLFAAIKTVLARMGVVHNVYFNEDSLYKTGKIQEVIEELRSKGLVYD